ncbi:MAG: hypothetical protein AAGC45_13295 [Bacteroidota bacterium]
MKVYPLIFLVSVLSISCKSDKKVEGPTEEVGPKSILEKIAMAHGYENWNTVQEIAFTFNVDRDSSHFERSWVWKPKTNDVMHINGSDTLQYNRATMDSVAFKTNAGFINDRYWLLAPFNLMWDRDNFTHEHNKEELAPISGEPMQKLTIVYGGEGGYTPGDAYDFFFGDDYLIREWIFRKANQPEPSMTTTWENYSNIKGFKLVKDHKRKEGGFNLYIDGISVTLKE